MLVKIPLATACLYEQFKNHLAPHFLSFVVTSVYIMFHDRVLGIIVLVIVMCIYATALLSPAKCHTATAEQEAKLSDIDEHAEDVLRNAVTVHLNERADDELAHVRRLEDEYQWSYERTVRCISRSRAFAIALMALLVALVGYTCYVKAERNALSAGTSVSIILMMVQWFAVLGWVIDNCRDLVVDWGIVVSYDRARRAARDRDPTCRRAEEDPWAVREDPGGIVFEDVVFQPRGHKHAVLNGASLVVPHGQRVGIVGGIGCGKTTMIKLLVGLQRASSGSIRIDGVPVGPATHAQLRRRIGFVPQSPVLFNRSIYENIVYGAPWATYEDVERLVARVGLTDAFRDLEGGLHARAGKSGSALSGGQRQLVSCLRALLPDPDIIVLDEVTSSIDAGTKALLMRFLDEALYGRTAIVVTHDPELLSIVDVVYEMRDGKPWPIQR